MKEKQIKNLKKLHLMLSFVPYKKQDIFMDIIEEFDVNFHLNIPVLEYVSNENIDNILGLYDNKKDLIISIIREDKIKDCLLALEDKYNIYKTKGYSICVPLESIIGIKNYLFFANLGGKVSGKRS